MKRCPTCRKAVAKETCGKLYPFCSERCHLVDLGRWLAEDYRVPAEPLEATEIDDSPEGT
ncbi:MAG: DNA gyrase inhibitor YacG [Kofleriaceae bacterium]